MFKPSNLVCAQCNSSGRGSLKRCGNCSIRFYCSVDCQRVHWKQHKVECKQIQEAAKALQDTALGLDLNHPFETMIADFIAEDFTEQSYKEACERAVAFILDPSGQEARQDLRLFTEQGFMRLNAFAIKALTVFPENNVVAENSLLMISFYIDYLSRKDEQSGFSNSTRLDLLFRAGLMEPIVNCVRTHPDNAIVAIRGWRMLKGLVFVDHTKYLAALERAGIIDLTMLTLESHDADEVACSEVCIAMSTFALQVVCKQMTNIVQRLQEKPLTMSIITAMRSHPSSSTVQSGCCLFLHRVARSMNPSYASMLVAMGVFEDTVEAIMKFPSEQLIVHPGAGILADLCAEYFADTSKPRNTSASYVLVSSLPYLGSGIDAAALLAITYAIFQINCFSRTSEVEFVYPGFGISILMILLEKRLRAIHNDGSSESVTAFMCGTIAKAILHAKRQWSNESPEYGEVQTSLKPELLDTLIKSLQKHKNSREVFVVDQLFTAVCYVTNYMPGVKASTLSVVLQLVEEVMAMHPKSKAIQDMGVRFVKAHKSITPK